MSVDHSVTATEPLLLPGLPRAVYLYENPDGTATVTYLPPSAVFAPYRHPEVRAVASELEPIFRTIVERALAER